MCEALDEQKAEAAEAEADAVVLAALQSAADAAADNPQDTEAAPEAAEDDYTAEELAVAESVGAEAHAEYALRLAADQGPD